MKAAMKLRILGLVSLCATANVADAGQPVPRDLKVIGAGIWEAGEAIVALQAWNFLEPAGTLAITTHAGTRLGTVACLIGEPRPQQHATTEAFMEVVFEEEDGASVRRAAYAGRDSIDDTTSRFALVDDVASPCRDGATWQLLRERASPLIGAAVVDSDCDRGPCAG